MNSLVHVLSIEDNPPEARLIQVKLREAERDGWHLPHFEVTHVDRLHKALDLLCDAEGPAVDVVLTDLDLPDSRSSDTIATLRDHIPTLPIVVLTSREDEAFAQKSVREGVQDYLYKNEAPGSLLARSLMYAIERQQTRDRLERQVDARTVELKQANARQVADLNWLTETAHHLLTLSSDEEILGYATRALHEKLRDCLILTLTDGAEDRTLRLREVRGLDDTTIGRAVALIGFDPRGMTFQIAPEFETIYRQGRLFRHEGGLPAFAASELPLPLGQTLARMFDIHDVYTIGLVGRTRVLGNVHILARRPALIRNKELVESFATQVALALEQATAHRAVEERETRLRTIIDHSTNLFYAHTPEHELTYLSPQVRDFLDCEPEEAMTRWTEFATDNPINQAGMTSTERAIASGEPQPPYELELVGKEGRTVWVEVREAPLVEDGETVAIVGSLTDVTERRKTEMAIRRSKAQLSAILNNTEQSFILVDPTYTIRTFNQTAARYTEGVFGQKLTAGTSILDFVLSSDKESFTRNFQRALRGETVTIEKTLPGKSDLWFSFTYNPIQASTGEITGVCFNTSDITARKQAEARLRRTTERLRIEHEIDTAILRARSMEEIAEETLKRLDRLIPCRHVGIAEIDPSQQYGRELVGLIDGEISRRHTTWRPLSEIDAPLIKRIRQNRAHRMDDISARETLSPLEAALSHARIRSYVSVPLMVQDTPIGTLNAGSEEPGFFQPDHIEMMEEIGASLAVALQQARLLEQTRQDAKTKELLLREVNHRVKNNLDAIIGLLYVERRHAPPEAQPVYRPIMERLTQRITGLAQVHEMLSQAEWAPLNLGELTEQIIHTTVRGTCDHTAVHCEVAPTPVRVRPAQAQHLALIISELTTNTLKYGRNGRDTIHITVKIAQSENTITLTYRNDGPPYPEDVLSLKWHSAGMDIITNFVRKNLRGDLTLSNEGGAVTEIRFQREE